VRPDLKPCRFSRKRGHELQIKSRIGIRTSLASLDSGIPNKGAARVCKLWNLHTREDVMAKKQADTVYKIVEVVGVSDKSWEEAGRRAVETAAGSLRDLRVAEVTKMDMRLEDGKVAAFRTRVSLSFKYEP
jgi:flavin-binding protein dodecin